MSLYDREKANMLMIYCNLLLQVVNHVFWFSLLRNIFIDRHLQWFVLSSDVIMDKTKFNLRR